LIIVSVGCGFAGGWLGSRHEDTVTSVQKQQVVLKSEGDLISNIASTVGKSVVSVNTTTQTQNVFGLGGEEQGAGTGIVLTAGGLIITNRHVVPAGTTSVSVTLSDGTEFDNVSVVGRTSQSDSLDIAFLKINDLKGKTLTPATIGDSSKMKVGDSVVAIGNALGQFQNTVTSGILSGYGRSVQASDSTGTSAENLQDLFQTDAAINEGNSGGPLVNLDGQVIGINTAIAGDAQSIGFAIPINDVSGLIKSVETSGSLQRPYLGVQYVSLTNDIAKQYNLSVSHGAYIPPASALGSSSIIAGGPAEKAGLQEGDIITAMDGTTIDQNNSLSSLINKHKVGDKVSLSVVRGGKTITVNATLGAAPTQ
ncbi:MAG TPA: trypsin-like peptidase domain-containing protein, partial [Candidatus Saccharimonadales bacterium]|nr:trypsin-like peptidase domain-containing protein [Candidatus Saccharimonadales bacterium]